MGPVVRGMVVVGAVLALLLVVAALLGVAAPAAGGKALARGVLDRGASVPPRDVTDLDMFTPEVGVAVAKLPPASGGDGHFYLARTRDGGEQWVITGWLPASLRTPLAQLLTMAFANPSQGYVMLLSSGHTEYTPNGGRTWSAVSLPGQSTTLSLQGNSLWVTSNRCATKSTDPSVCPTELAEMSVGQRRPSAIRHIPTEIAVRHTDRYRPTFAQATVRSRLGAQAVATEGGEGGPQAMMMTIDGGLHWSLLNEPCGEIPVSGLVQETLRHWTLQCEPSGGMQQGTVDIWSTTDAGVHWSLTAQGGEPGVGVEPIVGSIGDAMGFDLTVSGNGHVLWYLGQVDGIGTSTDGGAGWGGPDVPTDGYPGVIVTAGPTDAWLALPRTGLYRMLDGVDWARAS